MIPPDPIHRGRARIYRHPKIKSRALDLIPKRELRLKTRFRNPIPHELHPPKQAPPPHIADVFPPAQPPPQQTLQNPPHRRTPPHQPLPLHNRLHRERRPATKRMRLIRLPMINHRAPPPQPLHDLLPDQHPRNRRIPAPKPLPHRHDIRPHPFLLEREIRPRPPHPAHHLVQNHQHPVPIAHAPHGAEIPRRRGHTPARRADDRLRYKRYHPALRQLGVQLPRQPRHVVRSALLRALVLIRVRGADEGDIRGQKRLEGHFPREIRAHAHRPDGTPMVSLPPRHEPLPSPHPPLADLVEILPRELERRVHGFGAAPHEERFREPEGVPVEDEVREGFRGEGRVGACVDVGDGLELGLRGGEDFWVGVAEDGDGGAGAGVRYEGAGGEGEVDAGGVGYRVRGVEEGAVEEGGGGGPFWGGKRGGLCGGVGWVVWWRCSFFHGVCGHGVWGFFPLLSFFFLLLPMSGEI